MASFMILLDTFVPFAQTENTNILGQTIYRDMFVYTTWTRIRTTRFCGMSCHKDRMDRIAVGGAEEVLPDTELGVDS
ncbi:hypothetical protein ColTof4_05745 [Colletotrichum tofieldiae]|uniref:Secreted protein n=1 Tax=Colletotrichum liriopes TaxID=708192 RepID=A0AA37LVZ9_9PEZI|nr:hypothetical protein ColLi_09682 [Colletotrichum liriopes]GKT53569.1 hypothetical protein ColTof3_00908 [Colletotrichum tofieldiae]GKT73322.1 hypothetical protein ColTof4_05745 [Colletotrichum tofieldiae]GKT88003.1 hypothetical protein Ct61P_05853 [Colletotrichum tofieldiae]